MVHVKFFNNDAVKEFKPHRRTYCPSAEDGFFSHGKSWTLGIFLRSQLERLQDNSKEYLQWYDFSHWKYGAVPLQISDYCITFKL